jgi:protoporphyrinogen oxidase
MGVAAAVFAADWFNKFLIVHNTAALSHTRQPIPHASRSPGPAVKLAWNCPRLNLTFQGGVANALPKATPLASVPSAVSTTITTATMPATSAKASA